MRRRVLLAIIFCFIILLVAIQFFTWILLHEETLNINTPLQKPMIVQQSVETNHLQKVINYKSPTHHFHTSIPSDSQFSQFFTPPFILEEFPNDIQMHTLVSIFDSLFDESKSFLQEPPCLLSDLKLYLGSISVSLTRKRIHFPIISHFPTREYAGTYEQILDYDYHNASHYFTNQHSFVAAQSKTKLYKFDTSKVSHYRCIYKINNQLITKPVIAKVNQIGGSLLCDLTSEMIDLLEQHATIQGILVSVKDSSKEDSLQNWNQLLAKFTLKHPFELNANIAPMEWENATQKPFKMILSCAPLLWEQIQQGVIIEWIEYHKLVGVDHFFVYLREHNEQHLRWIVNYLKPYLEKHEVTLIQWRFGPLHEFYNAFQLPQSIDTSARAADLSDWFIVADTDEFFYPVQKSTLWQVMEEQQLSKDHFSALNWFFQGKNKPQEHDPLPNAKYILQRHISKCSHNNPFGFRTKTIGRSGKDVFLTASDAHYFNIAASVPLNTDELYMRHYYSAFGFRYCPFMGNGDEGADHTLDSSLWDRFGDKLGAAIDKFNAEWQQRANSTRINQLQ